jgi:glycogen operon protein
MIRLSGRETREISYRDDIVTGGDLLLIFNSSSSPVNFILPESEKGWEIYADTNVPSVDGLPQKLPGRNYLLNFDAAAVIQEIL